MTEEIFLLRGDNEATSGVSGINGDSKGVAGNGGSNNKQAGTSSSGNNNVGSTFPNAAKSIVLDLHGNPEVRVYKLKKRAGLFN